MYRKGGSGKGLTRGGLRADGQPLAWPPTGPSLKSLSHREAPPSVYKDSLYNRGALWLAAQRSVRLAYDSSVVDTAQTKGV